jgi:hypothetical protein
MPHAEGHGPRAEIADRQGDEQTRIIELETLCRGVAIRPAMRRCVAGFMLQVQFRHVRRHRAHAPWPPPRVPMQRVVEGVAIGGQIDLATLEHKTRVAQPVAVRQQRETRHA